MAKTIDLSVSSVMQAGAVRACMFDVEDIRAAAIAAGAIAVTVEISENTTVIVRTMEVPEAARALVKASSLDVTEQRVWSVSGAEVLITVEDLPVSMVGRLDLKETGDHCVVHATGTITAHMGFASPLVEAMLRDRMIDAIRAEVSTLRHRDDPRRPTAY